MYPGAHRESLGDKPAVTMAESGWTQTFSELDDGANRLSRLFRAAGLQPGDHVAICLENHERFLEILWGCEYAGLIYTAVSCRLGTDELAYIINDCGARVFITSQYKIDQAIEILDQTPAVELRLMLDGVANGHDSFEDTVAQYSPEPLTDRVAGRDMLYSSGTTGRPKGVLPEPSNLPLETRLTGVAGMWTSLFAMDETKVYLSPAPLYHAAPLRFCLGALSIGTPVVVMERFDAELFLQCVAKFKPTHTQVVPTMFVRMLKLPDVVRQAFDISSLECVVHAAAPCPVPIKHSMIDWWGPVLHEYYAGTEGNGFTYCNSEMWLAHEGTVGIPIGCTVHIVDDSGADVPTGETGSVYFDGGAPFTYHNDPDKTAASRHPQGWSTIGDVGHLDADNFLFLTDRKSYMIISGGVNVYPQEAENLLVTHPKVVDVAVFGVPNDDLGEEVKAVVQPVQMPSSPEEAASLANELMRFCRTDLADIKCPRSIDFRAELPRHATGKLYKRHLKDEYWQAAGRNI